MLRIGPLFLRRTLASALAVGALVALTPLAALATSFDFVSSGGQFTIASDTLSFGNGLTVSSASNDAGDPDTALVNAVVLLDPIVLTGLATPLPGGLTAIGIDDSLDYALRIFQNADDGGELILSATYHPGDFVVIGASGLISAEIVDGLSDVVVALPGYSDVADELAATSLLTDFNVTLSAAGQDIAARIAAGELVAGAVAGSVATVIPEPGTAVLMGLGLLGLASVPPARRPQG